MAGCRYLFELSVDVAQLRDPGRLLVVFIPEFIEFLWRLASSSTVLTKLAYLGLLLCVLRRMLKNAFLNALHEWYQGIHVAASTKPRFTLLGTRPMAEGNAVAELLGREIRNLIDHPSRE